jgi:NADP-dependent 3-hydroxy acid dehydrogenase YdfG
MKKTIFITGATAGIGAAAARKFAAGGFRLLLNGRRIERLTALCTALEQEFGCETHALPFDVRDREAVQTAIASLPTEWQQIDILLNNAGLAIGADPIQEGALVDWDAMLDTNVKGLLNVSHAVIPNMVARNSGHILNIGSVAGKEVYPGGNIYCASKYAVNAISQGMRIDLLRHGIRVSHIAPGMVETEFSVVRFGGDTERAKIPYKGIQPLVGDDIAEVAYWIATLPPHININDIVVMPTAQASATQVYRTTTA